MTFQGCEMENYIGLISSAYTFIDSHGVVSCVIVIIICAILHYFYEKRIIKFKGELDNKNLCIKKKIEIYIEFFDMFSEFEHSIRLLLRRFYHQLPTEEKERKMVFSEMLCDSKEKYNNYSIFIDKNNIFFDDETWKHLSDIRHISFKIIFEFGEIFIDSNENDRLELVETRREYFKKAEAFSQKTDRVKKEIRNFLKQLEDA